MKTIPQLLSLAVVALGLSSCCSMFGLTKQNGQFVTETKQVKTCKYDIEYVQVVTPGSAKSGKGGMVQTVEKKTPRYKTVTRKRWVSGGPCVRFYCPIKDACGTTSQSTILMATAQGATGSPHIGLIPTMKPIAP
jgi:hypothetical protein